ncbi:MAG: enoyl-CoA hydratase/isomerase family protein [Thermovirgaceae bacterium]
MSMEKIVIEKVQDQVTYVTLNRPEKMNAFDTSLADELNRAFLEVDTDEGTSVVIVKGEGRCFSAGIDLKELGEKTAMEYREWVEAMERPLFQISRMKKPVIAQVHGVAAANGLGLVASADLAVASEGARLGLTAINVGMNCVGPVLPVLRSVGRKRALEFLLTGRLVPAGEAQEMGLLNKVVPEEELKEATLELALVLAKKGPVALELAKRAFYMAEDMPYEKQFAYMNEVFARLCTTQDAKEGVQAFFDKRDPRWKGC